MMTDPELLMRQKNIEEKVRKTVQEKERKRIADAELNESGRSGVPEAPVTPSAPPIGGAGTAIKVATQCYHRNSIDMYTSFSPRGKQTTPGSLCAWSSHPT